MFYLAIGLFITSIILFFVAIGKLHTIASNARPTALGGYRDDSQQEEDEKQAKIAIAQLYIFFVVYMFLTILARGNPGRG